MRICLAIVSTALMILCLAGCSGLGSKPPQQSAGNPAPTPAPTPTPGSTLSALTRNYDNMRSGVNSQETLLTLTTATASHFGKLFSLPVDAHVYGQPLYVPGLAISGNGTHNVIFVATENDSVYAFDADQNLGRPLWQTSLLNSANGETPVPCADVQSCSIAASFGVTATPVISLERSTIYVEARSKQNGSYFHKLHALDLATGAEKFGGPTVIHASVQGNAPDHDAQGNVNFIPLQENSRPGLLLLNGVVYICFASNINDVLPYHGWVLGYSADALQPISVFNVTPNGEAGGIWSNNGPAADGNGNIYAVSGNGTPAPANNNFAQSFIKLTPQAGQLAVADFFTPFNASTLAGIDLDLGSGGLLLLPDQSGTQHTHLLVGAGKEGRIYLIDRDNMGKLNSTSDSQIVQSIPGAIGGSQTQERNFYAPVFWNGNVYFSGVNDVVKAFSFQNGLLSTTPVMEAGTTFSFPGAGLIVSSNGNTGGILWALEWHSDTHLGTLHAYDAANLSHELWNSDQSGSRDSLGIITRLNVPLVINGKAYVSGISSVTVFGMLP